MNDVCIQNDSISHKDVKRMFWKKPRAIKTNMNHSTAFGGSTTNDPSAQIKKMEERTKIKRKREQISMHEFSDVNSWNGISHYIKEFFFHTKYKNLEFP